MSEGYWAQTCPKCKKRYRWQGLMSMPPPCPHCHMDDQRRFGPQRAAPASPAQVQAQASQARRSITIPAAGNSDQSNVQYALELCDEIEATAEDVPDAGQDFAGSVCERTESIRATIAERRHATENQIGALKNMLSGLKAWIR
jgi:hypothetical protein